MPVNAMLSCVRVERPIRSVCDIKGESVTTWTCSWMCNNLYCCFFSLYYFEKVEKSVCMSVCLSVCLPACLPACLPGCLPACLAGCLWLDLCDVACKKSIDQIKVTYVSMATNKIPITKYRDLFFIFQCVTSPLLMNTSLLTYKVPFLRHVTWHNKFVCHFSSKHQCNNISISRSNIEGQRSRETVKVNCLFCYCSDILS